MRTGRLLVTTVLLATVALTAVPEAEAQYFRFGKNKVQYSDHDWHFLQTAHFDIYFYEPRGEALAQFTAHAAEEAYEEISHLFAYDIADRISILVYQGHNDFAVTNAVDLPAYADGIGGVTELFKNRVALPFMGDYREYRRILHHEIVHAVVNDMFYGGTLQRIIQSGTRLRLPLWFSEGIAEYSAMGWDTNSDMYLREAILNDRIGSVRHLRGFLAYRGGQGFFDYIAAQYGREKITEILHRVKASGSVESAFNRAVGLDLDDLSERWVQALRGVYYPEVTAREELGAIARPLVTRETGGRYNTGAAISPSGDRIAFLSATGPLFDVYVVETTGESRPRRLVAGQTSPEFESFRVLTPSISWNPAGSRLAVAVKYGSSDAIALVDVRTRRTQHVPVPEIDGIMSVRWSPDGRYIAFSGNAGPQADIYLLDLQTEEIVNLTDDVFSDLEPAWSPDGRSLVFHSDRGDNVDLGRHDAARFDMTAHDFGQFSLYRLNIEDGTLKRLTHDPDWDDTSAAFGNDPDRLLFISDRNGIPNLYELDLETRSTRPLTDLATGVIQVSLSADGRHAALVALRDGTPSVYTLRDPFARDVGDGLAPSVWAARVMGDAIAERPPALVVAHATTMQENPLLREAADPTPFLADLMRRKRLPADVSSRFFEVAAAETDADEAREPGADDPASSDYRGVRVDFRQYDFSDAFDDEEREETRASAEARARFQPVDNVREDGSYRPKSYRLRFTPDLIYGNLGYDAVFGVQSFTQMRFSDLLGNHRLTAATNLVIDLRNSDYLLSYEYLPQRIDYRLMAFHLARRLADFDRQKFFRYRNYGLVGSATYGIDKFRRVEAEVSVQGTVLTDLMEPTLRSRERIFLHPALTYTTDRTTPGFLAPHSGRRLAIRVAASPGPSVHFGTFLADGRQYFGTDYFSIALRGAAGASFGPDPPRFFAAGVQNWINPSFDGLPIRDENDFVFGTPILPLRGHAYDAGSGDRFALVNVEARFPLVAALLPGPLPVLPLYNLQGVAFVDAAAIADDGFSMWTNRDEDGRRVLDDVFVGAGVGLRLLVLGYPLRADWAWPFDGREFGSSRFHLSIGLDF